MPQTKSQTSQTIPDQDLIPSMGWRERLWHKQFGRPYHLHSHDHGSPNPDAPVIILLHGLASSSANWDPLIPLLSKTFRCITIDLLGFGDSPKPQWYSYTMEEHLRSLRITIRRLRLQQPFILLGHSLGGLLATRYAREHQSEISGLILLSPPVYTHEHIVKRSARRRTSMYLSAYDFITSHKRVTYENFVRLSRILPIMQFLVIKRVTWVPFVRSLSQCIRNQTLITDLKAVHVPVDVFYGLFDEVVVPHNVRQLSTISDISLYPLKVNHMVGKRYAAAVAKVITNRPPLSE